MAEKEPIKPQQREDDLEIKGPLGWSVRASGKQVILLVGIVASAGALLWMIRDHDVRASEKVIEISTVHQQQLQQVAHQQVRLQESLDTVVYVLSLEPEDRKNLRLAMPASLRAKLVEQERPR